MKRIVLSILLIAIVPLIGCKNDSTAPSAQQPTITSMTPAQVDPGRSNVEGHIFGTNLNGVIGVTLGDGITVSQISGVSASDIYVFFSVAREASTGSHEIVVRTAQGVANSTSVFKVGDNRLPFAKFTVSPGAGIKDTVFHFNASNSSDPDGAIASYLWNFDDGSNAQGKIVDHKFKKYGTLRVTLTVTDSRGASDYSSRFIDVDASKPPLATFSVSPESGDTNTDFHFDATSSRDPDGRISDFRWSFGDGSSSTGQSVTHRFASANSYAVSLVVVDNTGMSSLASRGIAVGSAPEPPPPGPPPPGPPPPVGDICAGNDFDGQPFDVVDVSGRVITGDVTFEECPGLCGEIRRNAVGIREFVGDVDGVSGNQLTYSPGNLPASTAPEVGESLRVIWLHCD